MFEHTSSVNSSTKDRIPLPEFSHYGWQENTKSLSNFLYLCQAKWHSCDKPDRERVHIVSPPPCYIAIIYGVSTPECPHDAQSNT